MEPVWLLFLVALGCFASQIHAETALASQNITTPIRACIVFYTGISECDPTQDPSTYTGYETELFRMMAASLANAGMSEWLTTNWTLTCTTWDQAVANLYLPHDQRSCDVSMGGIEMSSARREAGLKFVRSLYAGGDEIMIYAPENTDLWTFLKPFQKDVWLSIFATAAVVAVVVWLQEVPARRIARRPQAALKKLSNLSFTVVGMLLQGINNLTANSHGARLTLLAYCFMILIIINMYIAVLSSQITVKSINLNINGVSDIAGKPVGCFEESCPKLKERYSLSSLVPLPWNTQADELAMMGKLKNGEISALIIDAPFVSYYSAKDCDLHPVGSLLRPFDFGFAFGPEFTLDYLDRVELALTEIQEAGTAERLATQYLEPGGCSSKSSVSSSQISMTQIAGLWVFLGSAMVLGTIVNLIEWAYGHYNKQKDAMGSASFSAASFNSASAPLSGRTKSFMGALEFSPLGVAEANSTEEAIELLEAHIQHMGNKLTTKLEKMSAVLAHIAGSGGATGSVSMSAMRALLMDDAGAGGDKSLGGWSGSLHRAPSAGGPSSSVHGKATVREVSMQRQKSVGIALPPSPSPQPRPASQPASPQQQGPATAAHELAATNKVTPLKQVTIEDI